MPPNSNSMSNLFLPGVPEDLVRTAFDRAAGNEIASNKFASPESSAALAANAFGWFLDRPELLPVFPDLGDLDWPAREVSLEQEMRFPWRGGRHPWLDAAVVTDGHLIGVESKRFEPFRSAKAANLSPAYNRDVWGEGMVPWIALRDGLRADPARFRHLDATQLVKHAFGLVTEAARQGRAPVLVYLYAEPPRVTLEAIARHRAEVAGFAAAVAGARVRFAACSYREWLSGFTGDAAIHAAALIHHFEL